jgi:hypothetical protein
VPILKLNSSSGSSPAPSAAFDPTLATRDVFEDFLTSWYSGGSGMITSEYSWKTIQSGSPAFTVQGATTPSSSTHPGVLQITCSAAGDIGSISWGQFNTNTSAPFATGNGQILFEALVNIVAISNGTDNNQFNIGLSDAPAGTGSGNQIIFYYEVGTSTNWAIVCTSSSVYTTTVTSTPVTAGWQHLKFVVNAAGTLVTFYVNGVSIGTVSTNIPTAAIAPMLSLRKTLGSSARFFGIDYVWITKTFTTPR